MLAAWVAGAAAAWLLLPPISGAFRHPTAGLIPENPAAFRTAERDYRLFGTPLLTHTAVVARDANGLTAGQVARAARLAADVDLRKYDPLLRHIVFALPIANVGGIAGAAEHGTTVVTYLYYAPTTTSGAQVALAYTYARMLRDEGLPVAGPTGPIVARHQELAAIDRSLPLVEGSTIALIAVVLLLTFRGLLAPLVALAGAGVAFAVSTRLVAWVGRARGVVVPNEIEPVVVALLLGLVTDYTIFLFTGVRRRLAAGEERRAAVAAATGLYAPIILTAGLIVTLGAATLVVGSLGFFRAFGPAMALTVVVTLAVSLTFVPAALALTGRAAYWPGLRRGGVRRAPGPSWRRTVARFLALRPVSALLALLVAAPLVVAALLVGHLHLGFSILRGLPDRSPPKTAAAAASRGFAPGIVAPTEVLLESPRPLTRAAIERFQAGLLHVDGVAGVLGPRQQPKRIRQPVFLTRDRHAARLAVVLRDDPLSSPAIDDFRRLRAAVPRLLGLAGIRGASVSYGGETSLASETVGRILRDMLRIFPTLLAVNFVLLVVFLRALVAPLYLLAASALALAATFGITTWFFQSVLGHADVTYFVPLSTAVLLLSLGSDYNVFVVGRIWQERERRPLREAIAVAAPRASGAITVAGLALASSFALLLLIPVRAMHELAFAMALGILLDTFVVRSALVPALIGAFGGIGFWPRRRARAGPVE